GHAGDLLDLLLQEPQHGLLAERIRLRPRRGEEALDLLGDALLLREREGDRLRLVREVVLDRGDPGDLDAQVAVEAVLHEHHRVVAFLDGLRVEVPGELREVVVVVPDGDRNVLLGCLELVPNLLGEQLVEGGVLLSHGLTLVGEAACRIQGKAVLRPVARWPRRPHAATARRFGNSAGFTTCAMLTKPSADRVRMRGASGVARRAKRHGGRSGYRAVAGRVSAARMSACRVRRRARRARSASSPWARADVTRVRSRSPNA